MIRGPPCPLNKSGKFFVIQRYKHLSSSLMDSILRNTLVPLDLAR